jgi:hypothetical protein
MNISKKYFLDFKQVGVTALTLAGSGALVYLFPPKDRDIALAIGAAAIVLQNGPVQKTPMGYVEEAAAALEKFAPLLPADDQASLRPRLAAIIPSSPK